MRRILETLGAACLLTVLVVAPASGQEDGSPDPIEVLIDAFEAPAGQEFTIRFINNSLPGVASIEDPIGDFVHSTGQEPGFTAGHLDITSTWALEIDPGPVDVFAPTNASSVWARTGASEVDPPNFEPFHTFTGEQVHDGSQYEGGAVLFGFRLVDTPPSEPPGRCEYVVWINDLDRGETFVSNPNFPLDPAGGTNLAVGLALNPTDGPGLASGFALELQSSGGFARVFEADIRAFITPGYVGILAPAQLIGDPTAANFYTFCAEEDFIFEPEVSGADQTGLMEISADALGTVEFGARDLPPESTTSTTERTTTTTTPPDTTTTTQVAEGQEEGEGETGVLPWWPLLTASGVGLALLGWWLYKQDDSCSELLEAWEDARRAHQEAQQKADEAVDACESAELALKRLTRQRKQVCTAWPPVCWETEEGDWIEDGRGNRITARDVHMRKVALGDVWDEYRAGKLSAAEIEEKWREMDTPEFREEMRHTHLEYRELLDEIEAEMNRAQQDIDDACQSATEAQRTADEARKAVTETRAAYEQCLGRDEVEARTAGSRSTPTSGNGSS